MSDPNLRRAALAFAPGEAAIAAPALHLVTR